MVDQMVDQVVGDTRYVNCVIYAWTCYSEGKKPDYSQFDAIGNFGIMELTMLSWAKAFGDEFTVDWTRLTFICNLFGISHVGLMNHV